MRKKLSFIGIFLFVVTLGITLVILDDNKEIDYENLTISELIELSDDGNPEAQGMLAYFYQEGLDVEKDYEKSLELYLKSAKNGSTTSMVNIAYLYSHGMGVEQDYQESFKWNLQAAEKGDSSGMFNVSRQYEFGLGVEKNPEKASYWLEKSGKEL